MRSRLSDKVTRLVARFQSHVPIEPASRLFLGAGPLDGEGHMGGDDARQGQLVRVQGPRRRVVQHELADHPLRTDQRDEGQAHDSLSLEERPVRSERVVPTDVGDDDGLRIQGVGLPGRVAFDPLLVGGRQPAARLEAHHAIGIEEEDGRTFDAEAGVQGIQCALVDFLGGAAGADRSCQRQAPGPLRVGHVAADCTA
jgi:hypothetical protein